MKKIIAGIMATAIVASMASISAFAASPVIGSIYNGDGVLQAITGNNSYSMSPAQISGDQISPNTTFYFALGEYNVAAKASFGKLTTEAGSNATAATLETDDVVNTDLFKFSVDKDDNAKMIKSITVETEKSITGLNRGHYLKVVMNDSTTTSEMKLSGTITFKAKANMPTTGKLPKTAAVNNWVSGDRIDIPYTIWMNNTTAKDSAGTGDRVVMDPTKNDQNVFVWGDDRAGIFFEANDNAGKFYARLTTTSQADIYAEYGDPQNADLYFYNFVSNATIPSTARGTLTLGIPWDTDADYQIDPANAFIYSIDADGVLTDVTSQFTYDESNDSTTGIEGWSTKTRVLGNYVVSDTELDLAVIDETVDEAPTTDVPTTTEPGKDIPNTGSSDMVNVAVVAAVVSLAAAGAVAFRKVK